MHFAKAFRVFRACAVDWRFVSQRVSFPFLVVSNRVRVSSSLTLVVLNPVFLQAAMTETAIQHHLEAILCLYAHHVTRGRFGPVLQQHVQSLGEASHFSESEGVWIGEQL